MRSASALRRPPSRLERPRRAKATGLARGETLEGGVSLAALERAPREA